MKAVLKVVSAAGATACVTAYVTAVLAYVTATGDALAWPYPWLIYVAATFVALSIVWLALMLGDGGRLRGRGPDFRFSQRGPRSAEIRRIGKLEAFSIHQGDGQVEMSTYSERIAGPLLGDVQHGEVLQIGLPNDSGCWVWLSWIERGGRYYTKSVYVDPETRPINVTGVHWRRGEKLQS